MEVGVALKGVRVKGLKKAVALVHEVRHDDVRSFDA